MGDLIPFFYKKVIIMELNKIYHGHVLSVLKTFPDNCVDCIVTSPPYYNLRKYGDDSHAPIWNDDGNCMHEWQPYIKKGVDGGRKSSKLSTKGTDNFQSFEDSLVLECIRCNAVRCELGQEPSSDMFIEHLVEIFREGRRVLKPTGTLWLNMGDSYMGSGGKNNRDEIKDRSLMLIPQRLMIAMVQDGWIMRSDTVWYKPDCIDQTTTLYCKTQKGIGVRTLKDLVRLNPETVELWDGKKWNKVVKWLYNNNPQNTIQITLRNGEKIRCTGDHRFLIDSEEITASELEVGDTLDNCYFPNEAKIIKHLPDNLIGWFIGTYLADGFKQENYIDIASHINEIDRLKTCKEIVKHYDGTIYTYTENNSMTIRIYSKVLIEIINKYVGGKYAKNKHLKSSVWKRNDMFLESLMTGYLEGDGHWDSENRRWRLNFTRNRFLADNLRTLCGRLGYYMTLRESFASIGDKKYKSYNGQIKTSPNKKSFEIVDISEYNSGKYYDIILEDEPHVFSTASGLLVHNCMPHPDKTKNTPSHEHIYVMGYFPRFVPQAEYYYKQLVVPLKHKIVSGKREFGGNKFEGYGRDKYSGNEYVPNPIGVKNMRDTWLVKQPLGEVWENATANYSGSHFAVFPLELPLKAIEASCPLKVCTKCGEPVKIELVKAKDGNVNYNGKACKDYNENGVQNASEVKRRVQKSMGPKIWTEEVCDCNAPFQAGVVLDPFMGSGTTAIAALKKRVNYIGIELFNKNIELARERIEGFFPMVDSESLWEV